MSSQILSILNQNQMLRQSNRRRLAFIINEYYQDESNNHDEHVCNLFSDISYENY